QIILPLARLFKPETIITIQARPVGDSAGPLPGPEFEVEVLVCNSQHLRATQEERSIWVFSTARSGSTWVAHDIIGWRHRARVVDESGIGRMFAPLDWAAERFFAVEQRKEPYESGLAFETGQLRRTLPGVPPFERSFRDLGRELQVLNHMNFDLY